MKLREHARKALGLMIAERPEPLECLYPYPAWWMPEKHLNVQDRAQHGQEECSEAADQAKPFGVPDSPEPSPAVQLVEASGTFFRWVPLKLMGSRNLQQQSLGLQLGIWVGYMAKPEWGTWAATSVWAMWTFSKMVYAAMDRGLKGCMFLQVLMAQGPAAGYSTARDLGRLYGQTHTTMNTSGKQGCKQLVLFRTRSPDTFPSTSTATRTVARPHSDPTTARIANPAGPRHTERKKHTCLRVVRVALLFHAA